MKGTELMSGLDGWQPSQFRVQHKQKDIYEENMPRINPEFSSSQVPSSFLPLPYRNIKLILGRLEWDQEFIKAFLQLKASVCVETFQERVLPVP